MSTGVVLGLVHGRRKKMITRECVNLLPRADCTSDGLTVGINLVTGGLEGCMSPSTLIDLTSVFLSGWGNSDCLASYSSLYSGGDLGRTL